MEIVNCPTCGNPYASVDSMVVHHGKTHPEKWEDRFWFYVDEGDEDECWTYEGTIGDDGYGQFVREGDKLRANRVAYQLTAEEPSMEVHHVCENPQCCNPNHLYDTASL